MWRCDRCQNQPEDLSGGWHAAFQKTVYTFFFFLISLNTTLSVWLKWWFENVVAGSVKCLQGHIIWITEALTISVQEPGWILDSLCELWLLLLFPHVLMLSITSLLCEKPVSAQTSWDVGSVVFEGLSYLKACGASLLQHIHLYNDCCWIRTVVNITKSQCCGPLAELKAGHTRCSLGLNWLSIVIDCPSTWNLWGLGSDSEIFIACSCDWLSSDTVVRKTHELAELITVGNAV